MKLIEKYIYRTYTIDRVIDHFTFPSNPNNRPSPNVTNVKSELVYLPILTNAKSEPSISDLISTTNYKSIQTYPDFNHA